MSDGNFDLERKMREKKGPSDAWTAVKGTYTKKYMRNTRTSGNM